MYLSVHDHVSLFSWRIVPHKEKSFPIDHKCEKVRWTISVKVQLCGFQEIQILVWSSEQNVSPSVEWKRFSINVSVVSLLNPSGFKAGWTFIVGNIRFWQNVGFPYLHMQHSVLNVSQKLSRPLAQIC